MDRDYVRGPRPVQPHAAFTDTSATLLASPMPGPRPVRTMPEPTVPVQVQVIAPTPVVAPRPVRPAVPSIVVTPPTIAAPETVAAQPAFVPPAAPVTAVPRDRSRPRQLGASRAKRRLGRKLVAAVMVVGVIGAGGYSLAHRDAASPLQAARQQAPFGVIAPATGVANVNYDAAQKSVSYALPAPAVTVSQQAKPDQFADITGYADKFYAGLNQYGTITTALGTVHLVKPGTADVASFTTDDALVFISSQTKLSTDQWKTLVDSFKK